ncbi:MAG: sigma-70 family RNA polymerase sigma factor [Pseudomonadota bacterium]
MDSFENTLHAARAQNADALGQLMEDAAIFCWRVLARFDTLAQATREDLAHEVVVVMLDRGLANFKGNTEVQWKAYLKQAAINQALSLMRKDHSDVPEFWSLEDEVTPASTVEEHQAYEKLVDCVSELPADEHEIFWMRLREVSYEDMVIQLGIAQGTIASKYHRAQNKVKHCMEEVGFA